MQEEKALTEFVEILRRLRGENGCPWDREQTHESLREAMLEEAYEVVEAINKKDAANLCEELGDVLLQIVFHAELAREEGNFTLNEVIEGIRKKMILRHPHVFGGETLDTADAVLQQWEIRKRVEKQQKTHTDTLKAVADALPSLTKAKKVQKKAEAAGLPAGEKALVFASLSDQLHALETIPETEKNAAQMQWGQILFTLVRVARFFEINPEFALTKAIKEFINRFEYVEKSALLEDKALFDISPLALAAIWETNESEPRLGSTEE